MRLWPEAVDYDLQEAEDFKNLAQKIDGLRDEFSLISMTPSQYKALASYSKITEELWYRLRKSANIVTRAHFTKAGAKFLEMFRQIYHGRPTLAFVLADAEAPGSSVYAASLVFGWSGVPNTWPVAVISLIDDKGKVIGQDKRYGIQYENAITMQKVDFKGDISSPSDQMAIEKKFAHRVNLYTFDGGFFTHDLEEEYIKKKQFLVNAAKRACKVIMPGGCTIIKTFLLDEPGALVDGARHLHAAFTNVRILKPASSFVLNREIYVVAVDALNDPSEPPSVQDFMKTDEYKVFIRQLKKAQHAQIIAFEVMLKQRDEDIRLARLNGLREILSQDLTP